VILAAPWSGLYIRVPLAAVASATLTHAGPMGSPIAPAWSTISFVGAIVTVLVADPLPPRPSVTVTVYL